MTAPRGRRHHVPARGCGLRSLAVPAESSPFPRRLEEGRHVKEKDQSRKSDTQGVAPTVTEGGAMPGGNENAANANAGQRSFGIHADDSENDKDGDDNNNCFE